MNVLAAIVAFFKAIAVALRFVEKQQERGDEANEKEALARLDAKNKKVRDAFKPPPLAGP